MSRSNPADMSVRWVREGGNRPIEKLNPESIIVRRVRL